MAETAVVATVVARVEVMEGTEAVAVVAMAATVATLIEEWWFFSSLLVELRKMAADNEPLWMRSYETGREILNYDKYRKELCAENSNSIQGRKSIEASRESGLIFVDLPWLVQTFMDANQWKELFPCLISKAATIDVICSGEGDNRDGCKLGFSFSFDNFKSWDLDLHEQCTVA